MKGKEIPLSRRFVQGAIGKKFVIKHYKWGIVQTKFPAMQHIIPTQEQVKCRDLFKEAVAFAKTIMADASLKQRWIKLTRKKRRIFNAIIKIYMLMEKRAKQQASVRTTRLLRNCFKFSGRKPVCSFAIVGNSFYTPPYPAPAAARSHILASEDMRPLLSDQVIGGCFYFVTNSYPALQQPGLRPAANHQASLTFRENRYNSFKSGRLVTDHASAIK